jgi:hypothetical protein
MTKYMMIVRDSDGAILGSERTEAGVFAAVEGKASQVKGPFGDTPFADDRGTLAAGYSGQEIEIDVGERKPASATEMWNGTIFVPMPEAARTARLEAENPREAKIEALAAGRGATVSAAEMLLLLGRS